MSNIISVPLNKLTRSARNVRKSGGESIDDLASSILVHGLLHNLTVVEQLAANGENSGKYEVVAGGRRLAALQRLAKERKVPKRFGVPCHVVDPTTATEASLAEEITSAITGAHLIVVPECGHASTLEQPHVVNRALIAWITG
jgi:ParB family transcriptional regulator, chromosome partitioning protein